MEENTHPSGQEMTPSGSRPKTHTHSHDAVDPKLLSTQRGIRAVKWSFAGLLVTALIQLVIVFLSGSVALLADTIHNFGDASTAIPLWIAFSLARREPSRRFTYGYGRLEDLAGVVIVLTILFSAVVAGHQSIERLLDPQPIRQIPAVAAAALVGFIGNEWVARYRIKVGEEINSAALVADGHHARVDGLTSLGVLVSAAGVWLGYPLTDPLVGMAITLAILRIVWEAGKSVFVRLLDGVDPKIVSEIRHTVRHAAEVEAVTKVRARWIGHRLQAEINLELNPSLTIAEAHDIAKRVRHDVLHQLPQLFNASVHVDPRNGSGETLHGAPAPAHDDFDPSGQS
jgi:cation diffusion facilitator family transporter